MADDYSTNLQALYYQNLSAKLGNPTGFQIATGSMQITDQTTLNQVADSVPPLDLDASFTGNPLNSYSGNYGNIINGLMQPDKLGTALGSAYLNSWLDFQKANATKLDFTSQATLLQSQRVLMAQWGVMAAIPTGIVQNGQSALQQIQDNPVNVATTLWAGAGGGPYGFSPQSQNIAILFNNPASLSFSIDSLETKTNLQNTWAKGSFGVKYDLFSLGGSASYDTTSTNFLSKGFNLSFSCRSVTAQVMPLQNGEGFSVAGTQYKPWMNKSALQSAYKNKNDATVWQRSGDWDNYFGGRGTFQRAITAIYLADDVSIEMSSEYEFNSSDVTKIEAAAKVGLWPFFTAKASGGTTTSVGRDGNGHVTMTTTSPKGVPVLLGVATDSLANLMK